MTFLTMILSWVRELSRFSTQLNLSDGRFRLRQVAFAFLAAVAGVANNRIKDATDNYASVHMANGAWMVLAGAVSPHTSY